MPAKEKELIELLSSLIELDHDAIAAYRKAIEKLEDPECRTQLGRFLGDHERHVRELGALVREHGAEPPREGDMKSVLTTGKVSLGALVGDRAILKAMKSNEDDTNQKYERAVAHPSLPGGVAEVLRGNLEDERRHRAWIVERLEQM